MVVLFIGMAREVLSVTVALKDVMPDGMVTAEAVFIGMPHQVLLITVLF
jgi:hypothetical protein